MSLWQDISPEERASRLLAGEALARQRSPQTTADWRACSVEANVPLDTLRCLCDPVFAEKRRATDRARWADRPRHRIHKTGWARIRIKIAKLQQQDRVTRLIINRNMECSSGAGWVAVTLPRVRWLEARIA